MNFEFKNDNVISAQIFDFGSYKDVKDFFWDDFDTTFIIEALEKYKKHLQDDGDYYESCDNCGHHHTRLCSIYGHFTEDYDEFVWDDDKKRIVEFIKSSSNYIDYDESKSLGKYLGITANLVIEYCPVCSKFKILIDWDSDTDFATFKAKGWMDWDKNHKIYLIKGSSNKTAS